MRNLILVFCIVLAGNSSFAPVYAAKSVRARALEYTRYIDYPKPNYGKPPASEIIKKGEYLAKIGDCASCHTALKPGSKTFAGGLGINTPFGMFYTPNITADKETGIGKWSDDDFIMALHEGKMPHGTYYYPVFPFPYFTKISNDDLKAIKAYLFSLPKVHAPKKRNDMPLLFRWRFLQLGWRILFFEFDKGYYKYDSTQSKEWNRGAYIVQGLGHCGMCHTPLNFLGSAKNKYFLGGGKVDGFYAPDITSRAMSKTSVKDIVTALEQGNYIGGTQRLQGPMMEVEHNSMRFLKKSDIKAIAVYLKTVKSKPVPGSSMSDAKGSAIAIGKKVYKAKCAVCHDSGAAGAPKLGDKTAWASRIKLGEAQLVHNAIHGINAMPPKGTCMSCTDEQIADVVKYMMMAGGGDVKDTGAEVREGKPPRKPTLELGKTVYEKHCASCHQSGINGAPKLGDKVAWKPILQQSFDVLIDHSLHGYKKMPARGNCVQCKDVEIIAALKYMAQESKETGDYSLW